MIDQDADSSVHVRNPDHPAPMIHTIIQMGWLNWKTRELSETFIEEFKKRTRQLGVNVTVDRETDPEPQDGRLAIVFEREGRPFFTYRGIPSGYELASLCEGLRRLISLGDNRLQAGPAERPCHATLLSSATSPLTLNAGATLFSCAYLFPRMQGRMIGLDEYPFEIEKHELRETPTLFINGQRTLFSSQGASSITSLLMETFRPSET